MRHISFMSPPKLMQKSKAQIRFVQSKFMVLHALCTMHNLHARKKRRKKTSVAHKQMLSHTSHYHELMSQVWPVSTLFQTNDFPYPVGRLA